MRVMHLGLLALLLTGACRSAPEQNVGREPTICAADPARCERLCAGCDDVAACYRHGGECLLQGGAVKYFRDFADQNDDVFTPGCHYSFADAACTQNGQFVDGDSCLNAIAIIEYTVTLPCHQDCAARRECDAECKKLGLGPGTCQRVPNYCGPNQDSARCVCNGKPPPPPEP